MQADLDWCINGCGKRTIDNTNYCSGICLASDMISPTLSTTSTQPPSPMLLPTNEMQEISLITLGSFRNRPNQKRSFE